MLGRSLPLFLCAQIIGATLVSPTPTVSLGFQSTPSGPTLAWDAWDGTTGAAPTGYKVEQGTACGTWTTETDVGLVTSYLLPAAVLPTTTCFAVRAYNASAVSGDSNTVTWTPTQPAPDPRCVPPLGDRAVSVFITKMENTTGQPGSQARINMQLGSPNSPITTLNVRLAGNIARTVSGTDLTSVGGIWFTVPTTTGSYPLGLEAVNAYGCSTTQTKDALTNTMVVTVK